MGLLAWMLLVMMMGAGIGRNSDTLELRELGGFQSSRISSLSLTDDAALSRVPDLLQTHTISDFVYWYKM